MKLKHFAMAALSLALVAPQIACAEKPSKISKTVASVPTVAGVKSVNDIKKIMQSKFPEQKIKQISPAEIPNLYEVALESGKIVYIDNTGKYLLVGDLIDVELRRSITEARSQELFKIDFEKLPFDDAIKVVLGTGARKMAVFTDPDCPYCKKLDAELLTKIDNVTIYYFLYPLPFHPDAPRKSKLIWCAADKSKAWQDFMLKEGVLPEGDGNCKTPLEDIAKLSQTLGISGTPGIIFPNGQLIPGAIGAAQIEQLLNQPASK